MESGKRFGFSAVEKSEIWSRWKSGQSLHEIGRAFDKPHSSIRCFFAALRRHCPRSPSPLSPFAQLGRARRYFARNCFRFATS
jgi:hypothetical protein